MKTIRLNLIQHRGKLCMTLHFDQDARLNSLIKTLSFSRWSKSYQCWYVPPDQPSYENICKIFAGHAQVDDSIVKTKLVLRPCVTENKNAINAVAVQPPKKIPQPALSTKNKQALDRLTEELQLKAYSESTIRTYRNEFAQLLHLLKRRHVNDLQPDDLRRYMVFAMEKEGINEHTAHSRLNALKFYFEQVLKKEKFFWEVPRPKKPLMLPKVFSQDEISAIIKASGNIKHKTMLMLSYAAGLRVSEVVNIKVYDIDSGRMCIIIRAAKGKKDRVVRLSPVLLVMLREYWKQYKPVKRGYLFPGQNKNEPYSSRSLQLVLAAAKQKAGVLRPGSIHSLRHSFATHLLDKGTDVTMIQKLLGHNDIKTTLRYLHVTNRDILQVISPLDDLKL